MDLYLLFLFLPIPRLQKYHQDYGNQLNRISAALSLWAVHNMVSLRVNPIRNYDHHPGKTTGSRSCTLEKRNNSEIRASLMIECFAARESDEKSDPLGRCH